MSGSKPRHWLVVLGMILLVIVSGVIVVSGISLAVHGGGMDEVIEMAEKAGWGLVALVGAVVLILGIISQSTPRPSASPAGP